ncbi:MAG TPA: hypothetical protein VJ821_08695 [Anaerolineales bacterium]|nr:hypothetical protein [Anaerolineales bacterium]
MNIRCAFCQTPYTLSRVDMLDALQELDSKKLSHYDAHCPRCRRATPIPRQRLEMFMPRWREELKQFEAEMKEHPQPAAPAPDSKPGSVPVAEAASNPAPKAKSSPKPAAKATPKAEGEKKPARKKTSAATSSAKGKKITTKKSK